MGCTQSSNARKTIESERLQVQVRLEKKDPQDKRKILPRDAGNCVEEVSGHHHISSSSTSLPGVRTNGACFDWDDEEFLIVPSEHAGSSQMPSNRVRLAKPILNSTRLRSSLSLGRPDSSPIVAAALRQQLENGTRPLPDAAFREIATFSSLQLDSGTEAVPYFGFDCVGGAVEKPALSNSSCHICLCAPDDGKLWSLCKNSACLSIFCGPCIGRYAATKVEEALHFVPALRCPGCFCRVGTASWTPFVADASRKRYKANAAALLTVRCPRCDGTASLFLEDKERRESPQAIEENILSAIAPSGSECRSTLRSFWKEFSIGEIDGETLLNKLVEVGTEAGLYNSEGTSVDGLLPSDMRSFLVDLMATISDIERRVTFQLAILRRYPKIRTYCCRQKMCFKCKVKGWHPMVSCEDRQRRFLSIDSVGIQPCPTCGVPTQKTEGCSEVRCVCGNTWSWAEKANAIPGGVPAISVALGLPEKGPELLSTLLKFRADLAASGQNGWGVFHHAAAQRQRMQFQAGTREQLFPPHSDASRLEMLFSLGSEASALMDVPDDDGDTGLSVALAHDNAAGARLLIERGVLLHQQALTSLHDFSSPRVAAEACELLRPAAKKLEHSAGMLWFWIEVGMSDRAKEALQAGDPVETEAAAALVLLRAAKAAGANVRSASAGADALEKMLELAATEAGDSWSELRRSGATAVVRREIKLASLEHRQFDVQLLKALLLENADPQATVDMSRTGDAGRNAVPLVALAAGADPRAHGGSEVQVLKLLLESAASPVTPDDRGDPPLWWAISRPNVDVVRELVRQGANFPALPMLSENGRRLAFLLQRVGDRKTLASILRVFSPLFAKQSASSSCDPVWLRLLGPNAAVAAKEGATAFVAGDWGPRSIDEVAVSLSLVLSDGADPAAQDIHGLIEKEMKAAAGGKMWEDLERGTVTALLLKEFRSAHIDDRNIDIEWIRLLLKKGALVNATQQTVRYNSFHREWGDEDFTPLVLLANASEVAPEDAKTAVELLVEHKADVNCPDSDGDTALTWAVMKNNAPVVEALAEAGASLGQSLVEEDGSPLAAVAHPEILRSFAKVLGPKMRVTLNDFPSPPLWLVVQFGTPRALRRLLRQEDCPPVGQPEVEALLRRRVQGGGLASGILGGGNLEDLQIAAELRNALVLEASGDGENPSWDESARLWREMLSQGATGLLRQEVEGAFEGSFVVDVGFVEALLAMGAEPNLQVVIHNEEDDSELDLDEEGEEEDLDEDDEYYDENYEENLFDTDSGSETDRSALYSDRSEGTVESHSMVSNTRTRSEEVKMRL